MDGVLHSEPLDPALFEGVLREFQNVTIGKYSERENSGRGRTQVVGIISRRNYGVGEARNNDRYGDLLREARALAAKICPDINYTAIQLNHNYEAAPHRDKNNDGVSMVVAFGDYEGGELDIQDDSGEYRAHDLRHRPLRFRAGDRTHRVRAVTSGNRYSIVFFRQKFYRPFVEKYGSELSYDELMALLPERTAGQPASAVKIPT